MVWRSVSLDGRTDLYRLDNSTLTAIRYHGPSIRGPIVRTYAGAVGLGFPLMCDKTLPHVARASRQSLEAKGIDTIDWPPCSPGLNPTEHPWVGPSGATMLLF